MKYTKTESVIWLAFAGSCFRYLASRGISVDRRQAKQIYRDMAARTPDIGTIKENPLRMCLSGGMVWLSIFEAAEGNLSDETFGQMVEASMCSKRRKVRCHVERRTAAFRLKGGGDEDSCVRGGLSGGCADSPKEARHGSLH